MPVSSRRTNNTSQVGDNNAGFQIGQHIHNRNHKRKLRLKKEAKLDAEDDTILAAATARSEAHRSPTILEQIFDLQSSARFVEQSNRGTSIRNLVQPHAYKSIIFRSDVDELQECEHKIDILTGVKQQPNRGSEYHALPALDEPAKDIKRFREQADAIKDQLPFPEHTTAQSVLQTMLLTTSIPEQLTSACSVEQSTDVTRRRHHYIVGAGVALSQYCARNFTMAARKVADINRADGMVVPTSKDTIRLKHCTEVQAVLEKLRLFLTYQSARSHLLDLSLSDEATLRGFESLVENNILHVENSILFQLYRRDLEDEIEDLDDEQRGKIGTPLLVQSFESNKETERLEGELQRIENLTRPRTGITRVRRAGGRHLEVYGICDINELWRCVPMEVENLKWAAWYCGPLASDRITGHKAYKSDIWCARRLEILIGMVEGLIICYPLLQASSRFFRVQDWVIWSISDGAHDGWSSQPEWARISLRYRSHGMGTAEPSSDGGDHLWAFCWYLGTLLYQFATGDIPMLKEFGTINEVKEKRKHVLRKLSNASHLGLPRLTTMISDLLHEDHGLATHDSGDNLRAKHQRILEQTFATLSDMRDSMRKKSEEADKEGHRWWEKKNSHQGPQYIFRTKS